MAKILATGWVPEDIIGPYREKFDEVLVPSREKGNFTQEEVWDVINNYDVLFTISAFKFQKDLPQQRKCPEAQVCLRADSAFQNYGV